jgi:hypothetical protein
MKPRLILIAVLSSIELIAPPASSGGWLAIAPARAECEPGTHLDKTTVEEIRAKLIKAGYKNPVHLRKGCDNAWHGTASKDGTQVDVAVTPDGHIVEEGD